MSHDIFDRCDGGAMRAVWDVSYVVHVREMYVRSVWPGTFREVVGGV